jgi:predicted GTPase
MPYGNLIEQRCQRYSEPDDLKKYHCTIEEYEEYEQHIEAANLLFAGVDYEMILHSAEKEADVILWDGGNNDLPFFKPDIAITVADPLRAGDEISYYPGETNCLMADLILLNKVNSASQEDTKKVKSNLASIAEKTPIVLCDSVLTPEIEGKKGKDSEQDARKLIKGKKVLTVDDGPTLTHGGMRFGAATALARDYGAKEIIDPRPFAHGTIKKVFEKFKHLENTLPCMGYGEKQISDLQKTVDAASEHVDTIIFGTPINLNKLIKLEKPWVRVRYSLAPRESDLLKYTVERALKMKGAEHQTHKETEQLPGKK